MDDRRAAEFVGSLPGIGDPGQSMWTDEELHRYALGELAYFREHDVRVAVTGWTLSALLSTRLAGIPLVTEHAGAMVPPVFERGMLPAPSFRMGLPLEGLMPDRLRATLYNVGIVRRDIYLSGINRVAARLGVEGVPSFPALLLGDLTLVTEAPEVLGIPRADVDGWTPRDPSRYRSGTRLRYSGPVFAQLDRPVPERIERFLDGPGPVVYVAITSSREELVRSVVARLAPLGARIVVAATVHPLEDLGSDTVAVGGVLPSHRIMERVDLAVIAGGQGSVQSAIAAGLPFVGVPLQPEQDVNVAVVERRGAARRVPQTAADTPALTDAARAVLTDPAFRTRARRLQAAYAALDGPGRAAELIMELAVSPTRVDLV
jgi:UDP:flavonoid glycosyltransferase YjiC (YdhE family)